MASIKLLLTQIIIIVLAFKEISSHGMVMDPVARGSAYRKGFETPENYEDNQLFCGGMQVQHYQNGGRCGICGDDFNDPRPRKHEYGGKFGTGVIVKKYKKGQVTNITVRITANHMGKFYFSICPLDDTNEFETEECFQKHPVKLANGQVNYKLEPYTEQDIPIGVALPKNLSCDHCVFRWHWITGNNWGFCNNDFEEGALGCGPQEEFRTCSDIAIA